MRDISGPVKEILTETREQGRNSIPRTAMVFIDELSFLVSNAIVLMTALFSLLALARNEVSIAMSMLIFASFCAFRRDT